VKQPRGAARGAAMTENLALYRYIGFVETRRTMENGFNRVYMRWDFS
jgi:hypothetical protein